MYNRTLKKQAKTRVLSDAQEDRATQAPQVAPVVFSVDKTGVNSQSV